MRDWLKIRKNEFVEDYGKRVKTFYGITNLEHLSEYKIYKGIKRRCNVKEGNKDYINYVSRNITVCPRWKESFHYFYNDMGPRPTDEKYPSGISIWSIDRIDNNGNYEPGNCRWTTYTEQANNRSDNVFIGNKTVAQLSRENNINPGKYYYRLNNRSDLTDEEKINISYRDMLNITTVWYEGAYRSFYEIERMTGLPRKYLEYRVKRGMSIYDAISTPKHETILIEANGETHSISEWCEITGLSKQCIMDRYKANWDHNDIINTPAFKLVTFQGITRTVREWEEIMGEDGPSKRTMRDRISRGLSGTLVLRHSGRDSKGFHKDTTIILRDGNFMGFYFDVVHCAEITGILLDEVLAELKDPLGRIQYLKDYIKNKENVKMIIDEIFNTQQKKG